MNSNPLLASLNYLQPQQLANAIRAGNYDSLPTEDKMQAVQEQVRNGNNLDVWAELAHYFIRNNLIDEKSQPIDYSKAPEVYELMQINSHSPAQYVVPPGWGARSEGDSGKIFKMRFMPQSLRYEMADRMLNSPNAHELILNSLMLDTMPTHQASNPENLSGMPKSLKQKFIDTLVKAPDSELRKLPLAIQSMPHDTHEEIVRRLFAEKPIQTLATDFWPNIDRANPSSILKENPALSPLFKQLMIERAKILGQNPTGRIRYQSPMMHTSFLTQEDRDSLKSDPTLSPFFASDFWNEYERSVRPEHFATGLSLVSGKPEQITDHRGKSGSSEARMDILPILRKHAESVRSKIVDALENKTPIYNDDLAESKTLTGKKINGKWYIQAYRGVAGDFADDIRKTIGHQKGKAVKDRKLSFGSPAFSSWSIDPDVARRFANRGISGQPTGKGIIIKSLIPVERVIHSGFVAAHAGHRFEHPSEWELVVQHPEQKLVTKTSQLLLDDGNGKFAKPEILPNVPKSITKSESEDIIKMLHNDNTDGVHHAFHKQDFNSTEDKVSHIQKLHEVAHSVAFDPNARASFIRHLVRTNDTHALKMVLEDTGVNGFHKLAKDFDQLTGNDFMLYVMDNIVAKPEVLETDNPAFGDIVEDAVAHHANDLDAILSPLAQAPKVTNLYILSALANTAYSQHPDRMYEELKVPTKTVYKLPAKAQIGFIVHSIKAQDMHNKYDVVKMADTLHESMGDAFANKLKEQLKDVALTNPLLLSVKRSKDKHGLEDHLTVKAGSGVLRKLRDHLLSTGDISPNELPEGKWNSLTKKVGKATVADWEPLLEKNGKLSAAKVQDYLDRMEGTTYGFSLSTTPEGETVFNLKIPKHELNKLHATGADETLKRLVHLSQGSGNPIEDRTIGWMKFKNNEDGHMEVTEVQSDLDMDMADTLRRQMEKEYGTVDEGEYGRHLEKLHAIYPPAHLHQLQELVFKGRPSADVIREAFHEYARKNGMVGKKTDGQEVRKTEKGAA